MKKIFYSILALCLVIAGAASCQKEKFGSINDGNFKVSATIDPVDTRVSYVDADNTITPTWAIDDVVFGWDDKGGTFTFTVSEVNAGVATMTTGGYAPAAGATKLYAIYYPGKGIGDIVANEVAVDLSTQNGSFTTIPALMCATGTINAGAATLNFANKTAIVGIKKLQVGANDVVTGFKLAGAKLAGKFEVVDGAITLTATGDPATINATVNITADGEGKITTEPLYFAVLPTADANLALSATTSTKEYLNVTAIPSTSLVASNYYYMTKIMDEPVAQIGVAKYGTIEEAFAAANASNSDCTIQLLSDCSATVDTLRINNGSAKVTLDLNDCILSGRIKAETSLDIEDSGEYGKITADSGTVTIGETTATLTILGGTITATSGNYAVYAEGVSGTKPSVLIVSGTVTAPSGNAIRSKYATVTFGNETPGTISVSGSTSIWTSTGSTVTINRGTYSATSRVVYFGDSSSYVTIHDGTIISESNLWGYYKAATNPTLNIDGGRFSWSGTSGQAGHTKYYVSGGIYSQIVSGAIIEDGYGCLDNTDPATSSTYPYMVAVDARPAATVNGTDYSSIDEAITAALAYDGSHAEVVLTLHKDVTVSTQIDWDNVAGKPITLDLNDCTFTHTLDSAMTTHNVWNITDNSVNKQGTITSGTRKILFIESGSGVINISNCTLSSTIDGFGNTGNIRSVVAITTGTINIDNARVKTSSFFKPFYVGTATLNITDSEVTCGTVGGSNGYCCIFAAEGSNIALLRSSLYSSPKTNANNDWNAAAIRVGGAATIDITDCYLWGYNSGNNYPLYGSKSATITISGGFYNGSVSTRSGVTVADGQTQVTLSPAVTRMIDGVTVSYGYAIQ